MSYPPGYCTSNYDLTHNLTAAEWASCVRLSWAHDTAGVTSPGLVVGTVALGVGWLIVWAVWRRLRPRRRRA